MDFIFKVCALVTVCVICCMVLKTFSTSQTAVLAVAGAIIVILATLPKFYEIISYARKLANGTDVSEFITPIIKSGAVVLITEITADICDRAGENILTKAVTVAGRMEILIIALPIFSSLAGTVLDSFVG